MPLFLFFGSEVAQKGKNRDVIRQLNYFLIDLKRRDQAVVEQFAIEASFLYSFYKRSNYFNDISAVFYFYKL